PAPPPARAFPEERRAGGRQPTERRANRDGSLSTCGLSTGGARTPGTCFRFRFSPGLAGRGVGAGPCAPNRKRGRPPSLPVPHPTGKCRAMAPDTPESAATPTPTAEVRDRIRIRFTKGGALRLLSHHDLMRAFERMLRRADLPFRNSQGFHPKPRIVFALSLPLGVVGREEVVELELSQVLPLDELRRRRTAQCPPGLELLSLRRREGRAAAQVKALTYRIALPPERVAAVRQRIDGVLAAKECWVERTRPPARRVDLRAFVRDLRITPD